MSWIIEPLAQTSMIIFLVCYIPLGISCFMDLKHNKILDILALVGMIPYAITMIIFIIDVVIYGIIKAWELYF